MKRKSWIFIKLLPSIELDYIHIDASDELFNFLSIFMDGSSCHMLLEFFFGTKKWNFRTQNAHNPTIFRFPVFFSLFVIVFGDVIKHTQTLLSHAFHSNDFEFTFVWAPKFCLVNFYYYYYSSWTVLRSNRAGPKKILLGIRRRRCPFSSSQHSIHNQNWWWYMLSVFQNTMCVRIVLQNITFILHLAHHQQHYQHHLPSKQRNQFGRYLNRCSQFSLECCLCTHIIQPKKHGHHFYFVFDVTLNPNWILIMFFN